MPLAGARRPDRYPASTTLGLTDTSQLNMESHSPHMLLGDQNIQSRDMIGDDDSGFPGSSVGKESAYNSGDPGSIPGLGRSPGERKGYLLQDSWEYTFC